MIVKTQVLNCFGIGEAHRDELPFLKIWQPLEIELWQSLYDQSPPNALRGHCAKMLANSRCKMEAVNQLFMQPETMIYE